MLRRDQLVDEEHVDMVLDRRDVDLGEPVLGHALAVLGMHDGGNTLGVQQSAFGTRWTPFWYP